MLAYGISPLDIRQAINQANLDLPVGKQYRGRTELTIEAPSELASLDELAAVSVARSEGGTIRLDQVARIHNGHGEIDRIIRVGGQQGIRIAIRKESDANTVEVAQYILDEIERSNQQLPQVLVTPVLNQGNFIERNRLMSPNQSSMMGP